jgi:branched-chain amino acid transport system permease protein
MDDEQSICAPGGYLASDAATALIHRVRLGDVSPRRGETKQAVAGRPGFDIPPNALAPYSPHRYAPAAVAFASDPFPTHRGAMAYFLQQLINGLTLGAIYGLIAIGYTMVYGIIGMINFAHGEIFMIGSFIALISFLLLAQMGLHSPLTAVLVVLVVSMPFTAAYGWAVERVAYRPLRDSYKLAPLISAIGMSIFLQNYVQLFQGARSKPLQPILEGGIALWQSNGFQVQVSYLQIIIVVLTVALMAGFSYVIQATPLGRSQRACEQDRTMAALLGVDVDRTISMTFVLGAALAAVAGLMFTLYYGVIDFFIGFLAGVKAFTAAVLGGIGSLPGAMLGGLLIGLIEAFWSAYFTIEYKDVAVFAVLVLVLIFRPTGLLGRPEIEKV